jgi:hypothetical protein
MEILTPIYKEIGCCVMSDGWKSTKNRPILNVITAGDGHVNIHRVFDSSGLDKNKSFIADFVMKEIKSLGQEHVFSCTMDGASKGVFPMIKHDMSKPDNNTQQMFNKVRYVILSQTDFWKNLDLCCQIFEPVLQSLSVSER